jgi:hypothetical protein
LAYLINRTPTAILSDKTPYEKLYNTQPNYKHLRIFGCLSFASTHSQNPSKFDPHATQFVLSSSMKITFPLPTTHLNLLPSSFLLHLISLKVKTLLLLTLRAIPSLFPQNLHHFPIVSPNDPLRPFNHQPTSAIFILDRSYRLNPPIH